MKALGIVTRLFITLAATFTLVACSDGDSKYTLYRSGLNFANNQADISMRIHIATFDANEGLSNEDKTKYNQANCEFAQELFNLKQPHYSETGMGKVAMKYWCEKGGYKK